MTSILQAKETKYQMEQRKYSLDFIKVVATVFIFCHHYQQYLGGMIEGGLNFYGGRFNFGLMVEMFFLLSGFFVWPYVKKIHGGMSFKSFFLHKAKRLVPMVCICAIGFQVIVLIYYAIFHRLEWYFNTISIWELILACTGLQKGWVYAENIYVNYPVWYISVLLLCFVFFWVGTYICKKLHTSSRYFYVIMIFWGLSINSYDINGPFMSHYNARGYISFFAGVLLASYFFDKKISLKESVFSFMVIAFLSVIYIVKPECFDIRIEYILVFVFYPSLIILFLSDGVRRLFNFKFWKTAAGICFNGFMWHYPMLIVLLIFMEKIPDAVNRNSYPGMCVFLILTLSVGALSYVFIENGLVKKIFK